MTASPTPTNVTLENASMSVQTGFADATGLGGVVIFLLYIIGALLAASYVAPWLAKSRLLSRTGARIADSMEYAIKGAASAVLAVAAAPVYLLTQLDAGTRGVALRYFGYAIVTYIVLVIVGWLTDRAIRAFVDAHPEIDALGDLLPDDELEVPDS